MAEPKFNAGDLVQLKSGSPVMTVDELDCHYDGEWKGGYSCAWFSGAKNNHRVFMEAALIPAEADK